MKVFTSTDSSANFADAGEIAVPGSSSAGLIGTSTCKLARILDVKDIPIEEFITAVQTCQIRRVGHWTHEEVDRRLKETRRLTAKFHVGDRLMVQNSKLIKI